MKRPRTGTRERLIQTAERLFALHGIDAVSMRSICAEAEQKNNTALQYHFGDKQNLIEAILTERMSVINEQRQAMLDEIVRDGCEEDLHRLVSALVDPFTDQLRGDVGGRHYVRFTAQLFSRGNAIDMLAARRPSSEAFHSIVELIRARLDDVPDRVLTERLALVASQVVHATAAKEYVLSKSSAKSRSRTVTQFSTDLVDYIVGGLTAPVSKAADVSTGRGAAA